MDLKKLLNIADSNKSEATYEASFKRYSSSLPPPKKMPKSGVQSAGIKAFLDKKKAEQEAIEAAALRKKQELLALRAQSSKNNKKAKIMASRTKDNDFSRIKLTEDEIESKKKREAEIIRQNLAGKVERMKVRIELEEKEKLLPKKRKRKSKNGNAEDTATHVEDIAEDIAISERNHDKKPDKNKIRRPPPPTLSFSELLKVAEQKQHEPIVIPVKKKEEEKLMTKKEKRMMEEELARLRRKEQMLQERLLGVPPKAKNPRNENLPSASVSKKNVPQKQQETHTTKKPVIVHVEKNSPSSKPDVSKSKIHKLNGDSSKSVGNDKGIPSQRIKEQNGIRTQTSAKCNLNTEKGHMSKVGLEERRKTGPVVKNENSYVREQSTKKKMLQSKNSINSATASLPQCTTNVPSSPAIDIAAMERKVREDLEKEMMKKLEEKFAAQLASFQKMQNAAEEKSISNKKTVKPLPKKAPIAINKDLKSKLSREEIEIIMKKRAAAAAREAKPQKKPFHSNPYLDPPRRLLEPVRHNRPQQKRRLESDDEDEEDDDDMSDFIDDRPSQNDEDYSKYIQEIFGYDKNRYEDDDDDDIVESSYSEMQKEEVRSAKLGYLEDLEEEKKLREMERKKKKKNKR